MAVHGWREQLTNYKSEDPSPTLPTHRMKKEKGKAVDDKNWASSKANEKPLVQHLKPVISAPTITGSPSPLHRDTDRKMKILRYCKVLQWGGAVSAPMCDHSTAFNTPTHTAQVEHHKEGASGYT